MTRAKFAGSILSCFIFFSSGPLRSARPQQTNNSAIERYSQEAKEALARKDLDVATQALEKLTRLTPGVAEVFGNLGMVYYAQGRYRQAAAAFERAFILNPQMPNAKLMMGVCFAQTGQATKALPILEPAFRHPPENEIGRVIGWQLQRVYVTLGQPAKAIEVSEEMLRRYPDDPETLYDASHLHGDRALQTMIRLANVAPDSPWTHIAFGEAFEARMLYDLAANEYRLAIRGDARLPTAHFRLGRALLHTLKDEKITQEALEAFQQEVALDHENSDAWYEIGEIHRERGHLDQARQAFQEAVEFHPEFEDAHIGLARTLINLNRSQDALPHLEAAVRLNPSNEVSHFLLARVYKIQGNTASYQKELGLFQKCHEHQLTSIIDRESQLARTFSGQEVTKQTLDPASREGPY